MAVIRLELYYKVVIGKEYVVNMTTGSWVLA